MKYTISFIISLFLVSTVYSQVGINTEPHESAMLHVESADRAVLFPQVQLVSADQLSPLPVTTPENTIVFNKSAAGYGTNRLLKGYYVWHEGKWISPLISKKRKEATRFYANKTTAFVFNGTAGTSKDVEAFNTVDFCDNSTLYDVVDNKQLRINKTGTYLITTNLGLKNSKSSASNIEIYMAYYLDGSIVSSKVVTRVPQNRGVTVENKSFSYSLIDYIIVDTPGQILSIKAITNFNDTGDTVTYDTSNESNITIVRISDEY